MVIIVFRYSPISLQSLRKESDQLKTGMRDEKGARGGMREELKKQKSVHVNITLPLSQIMRRIQVSHWFHCRNDAPEEEINTIKSPVQSEEKTERRER